MISKFVVLLGSVLVLVLAGCSPAVSTPDVDTSPRAGGLPPEAVLDAQAQLAEALAVSTAAIEIISTEQVEWNNACLELPEAGEACAEVITPGWRAIVEVNGNRYELRTDETGSTVRWQQLSE